MGFREVTSAQMHNFSDASKQGYGVLSYLLLHNEQLLAHSTLLLSKARVTPLKPITILHLDSIKESCSMDPLFEKKS